MRATSPSPTVALRSSGLSGTVFGVAVIEAAAPLWLSSNARTSTVYSEPLLRSVTVWEMVFAPIPLIAVQSGVQVLPSSLLIR